MELPIVFLLLVLASITHSQKTYRQHCDCEYMVDGKCAYTLMLPTCERTCQSTCPEDSRSSAEYSEQMEASADNLAKLSDYVTETMSQVAQLQSSLINLQQRTLNDSALIEKLADHEERLLKMFADLDKLREATENILANNHEHTESPHNDDNDDDDDDDDDDDNDEKFMELSRVQNLTLTRIERLERELEQVKKEQASGGQEDLSGLLCQEKGLMVSGQEQRIAFDKISVSSMYDDTHGIDKVRIDAVGPPGAWCAFEPNEDYEWVQFDLGEPRTIFSIVTRGRSDYVQWVTSYKLQYTNNIEEEDAWTTYTDVVGLDMIFAGNSDSNTPVMNTLYQPIRAQYWRIWPLTGPRNLCMRADLIGCKPRIPL